LTSDAPGLVEPGRALPTLTHCERRHSAWEIATAASWTDSGTRGHRHSWLLRNFTRTLEALAHRALAFFSGFPADFAGSSYRAYVQRSPLIWLLDSGQPRPTRERLGFQRAEDWPRGPLTNPLGLVARRPEPNLHHYHTLPAAKVKLLYSTKW